MANIRRPPGQFGPVAPALGAAAGAGLQAAGQALGAFADLGTNRELLNIRDQEQFDRLEFAQFEKVERSEAIAQFTQKQIWRNQESERVLSEARQSRNFSGVQKAMDGFEDDFNVGLFKGRSQVFKDAFESMDRSARVGQINKLGTAIQAGNLGLIQENFQSAARGFVEAVGLLSDPAEIAERFTDLADSMVRMGFTQAAIEAISGDGLREAMEKYVRSLPLPDGLAALSDEAVAGALGEDGRERMLRDLNTKANRLRTAEKSLSAAHERTTGIDLLGAFVGGESATSIANRIKGDENIPPIRKRDMLDLLDVIAAAREKGPESVDPEVIETNQILSLKTVEQISGRIKATIEKDLEPNDREKEVLSLIDEAVDVYLDAVVKNEQGAFGSPKLAELGLLVTSLAEPLYVQEQSAKTAGVFERLFGPGAINSQTMRSPVAIVGDEIHRMNSGKGRYGDLSSADKVFVALLLTNEVVQIADFNLPIATQEAAALAQQLFSVIDKRFLIEQKGIAPENVEQARELMLNSGTPATEPRQLPDISGVADSIRESLNSGFTLEQIEEFMRTQQNFTQEAFDRAAATIQVTQ